MYQTLLTLLFIVAVAGAGRLAANDSDSPAATLHSLHGTMITMISEDEGIPMEIWAKGNDVRSEFRPNGSKIISIQHGDTTYTYGEGSTSGNRMKVRRGLGSMGLIKQIEEVKRLGKKQGSVQIDGKTHDIYYYDVQAPEAFAIVQLCRETSLPRLWVSIVKTNDDTAEGMRMVFREMEANVDLPDTLFEIPKHVQFSSPNATATSEIASKQVTEPPPAPPTDVAAPSTLLVVVSADTQVRQDDGTPATLQPGDVAHLVKREDSKTLVRTSRVRGWIDSHDAIPLEDAETYFNARLDTDPSNVTALTGRAKLLAFLAENSPPPVAGSDVLLKLALMDFNRLVSMAPTASAFAQRGKVLAMTRDYQSAITDFDKALAMDPDNADTLRRRADARIQIDDLDHAIQDCDALIQLNADDAMNHSLRCYALGLKGEFDEAMLSCNTAIDLDKDFADAYLRRGTIWSALNNDTRAKADYDAAIELGEDSARIVRSRVLMRQGKYKEAIADLDVAIQLHPQEWNFYLDRGSSRMELGDFDRAIDDLSTVIEHQPTSFPALANRGLARAQKGDYDKAIEDFSAAIKLKPDAERLYAYRAQLYAGKQAHLKAIEDYTKLLEMSPNDADAYVQRGLSYYFSKQYINAIKDFDSAAKYQPDDIRIYLFRGSARNGAEDFKGAVEDFSRVIDAVPDAADALTYRGTAWLQLNEPDKALADFDQAVEVDSSFDQAWINRGSYWSTAQEYAKALADWRKAWELNPRRPETANELARLLAECPDNTYRNTDRAIDFARRSCELTDWSHHEYLETLAIAYAEAGDFDSAVKWMKKSLELAPGDHRDEAEQRLQSYQKGQSFRSDPTTK